MRSPKGLIAGSGGAVIAPAAPQALFHRVPGGRTLGIIGATAMRIYIFKSDANAELRAFSDDQSGVKLPVRFRPWHVFGSIAAGNDPPHGLPRSNIERAIRDTGFQLWRMKRQTEDV